MPGMNPQVLQDSLNAVAARGPELVEYFYARLFLLAAAHQQGEVLGMFPLLMDAQRDKLLNALVSITAQAAAGDMDSLTAYLEEAGRNHRMISDLRPEHYELVGAALVSTLAQFAGEAWTAEADESWKEAYALISGVMIKAMEDDGTPRSWEASVTGNRMLTQDVLAMTVQLDQPMDWVPGQSVKAEIIQPAAAAPAVRRFLTPVNRPGTTWMDFHVKVIPWGMFSPALARCAPGSQLRLSSPGGSLRLDEMTGRPMLMLAGSTGLSPMMAMLMAIGDKKDPPQVSLYFGARNPRGLYAARELDKMAAANPWLTVTYAVDAPPSRTPGYRGKHGTVVDVALHGEWRDHDVYVCGPPEMVQAAVRRLEALSFPASQVHTETYGSI